MKPKRILIASWVVIAMLSVPTVLSADTRDAAKVSHVADHLSVFEQQAAQVSRDAETLLSLARNRHISWESHTYYLNTLRHRINEMGRMLAELEEMKPRACEVERTAIEQARPHLVALAHETGDAMNLAREGSRNLRQAEYKETVADVSLHADGLYQALDTIVDYHNANDRLQSLEPTHSISEN